MNGHGDDSDVGEGELMAQMDIEGTEWQVLANARVEDLKKCRWYLDRLINQLEAKK